MYKVESFNLDHTKVHAPFIRLASVKTGPLGDKISKFDIRICQPNSECMETSGIHALEHLLAEYIRYSSELDVVDLSPMGCRTGFYLIVLGEPEISKVLEVLMKVFNEVMNSDKVPANTPIECGNYKDLNLDLAKVYAHKFMEGINKKGPAPYL